MLNLNDSTNSDDPYDLSRFVRAQEDDYEQAGVDCKDSGFGLLARFINSCCILPKLFPYVSTRRYLQSAPGI
jgi:hypothetical protein